jgi:phosphatidylserine/phosphatidylglycerophosphate/cardiolipin synthase-like enzyme
MPKYLRTSGISSEIDNLIRDAKERLYIISPYLKLSDNVKELLNDKEREKVDVRIIFGKQELNPTELSFLENLKYVRLYFSKNLHAKCYLNERVMIITSMNLYEFSQQNNREMGILIRKEDNNDTLVYEDAWKDIQSILNNSEDFAYIRASNEAERIKPESRRERDKPEPRRERDQSEPRREVNKQESRNKRSSGFCIRSGVEIPFNLERPMSYDAYKVWSQFGNPDYPERFCHFSGESSNGETSVNKPILKKNWRLARETYST